MDTSKNATDAEWRLAKRLYETMEYLDPEADEAVSWADLGDRQREFYRLLILHLFSEREDVLRVLEVNVANDDMINRHR